MFGISRKQDDSRELLTKQSLLERYSRAFSEITEEQQDAKQKMTSVEESQSELDKQLTRAIEAVNRAGDENEQQSRERSELEEQAEALAEGLEKSENCYHQIVTKIKSQNDEISEFVTQNRELAAPAKFFSQAAQEWRQDMESMQSSIAGMSDMGHEMGVLSLNAAIEAGRMGESGRQFVAAAEDVRKLAGQYQQLAAELKDIMEKFSSRLTEAEEQTAQLNRLLEEQTVRAEKTAKEFADSVYRLEHSDIQNFTPQMQKLAERIQNGGEHEKEASRQYALATDAMELTEKNFRQQQETLEKWKQHMDMINEQIKAVKIAEEEGN